MKTEDDQIGFEILALTVAVILSASIFFAALGGYQPCSDCICSAETK